MKNVNKVLLSSLIISLAAAVVGCNSGSSSSSGNAAPNVNTLTVPTGFSASATVGTSPVLFNVESGQVALPSAAGYQVVQLPANVAAALSPTAYQTATITGASDGSVMISLPTVTYQIIPSTTTSSKAIASTAESYAITLSTTTSNVVAFGGSTATSIPAGVVYGGTDGNLYVNTGTGASTTVDYMTACGVSSGDTIENITPATYNSSSYYAIGTASGVVCVLSGATGTWTNMSNQAPTTGANAYNPGNGIANLGFYGSGNSLLGFWTAANSGGNTVYQVNGTFNNGTFTPNAFWNISTNGNQSNNSGSQTINVSGAPSTITSTTTDTKGNLWAGSTGGKVYVLRTGSTSWSYTQLANQTGNTTVYQTTGTGASVTVAGSTTVYSAQ